MAEKKRPPRFITELDPRLKPEFETAELRLLAFSDGMTRATRVPGRMFQLANDPNLAGRVGDKVEEQIRKWGRHLTPSTVEAELLRRTIDRATIVACKIRPTGLVENRVVVVEVELRRRSLKLATFHSTFNLAGNIDTWSFRVLQTMSA